MFAHSLCYCLKFKQLYPFTSSCLGELLLTYVHAGDTELAGCPHTVTLQNLRAHARELPFRDGSKAPPRYSTLSSSVGTLLNAPNEPLQGDGGTKLSMKLIDARSVKGRLEQPTRGSTAVRKWILVCRVSSAQASSSTLRRRQSTLEGI